MLIIKYGYIHKSTKKVDDNNESASKPLNDSGNNSEYKGLTFRDMTNNLIHPTIVIEQSNSEV